MWKVLIADDEPKIRRGLRTTVERLRPDMKVVAEAEDGETALALVESVKPDILMIDIRMPFLNGLELIERINQVHRDCVIIVVSGHDEFEYAKRALQLKVFEYVLKPVPTEMLASVLERAEAELAGTKIAIYAMNGFCSALAGIVFTFYTLSGYALNGKGMELDVIATVVIGGTLLTGGAGSILGTVVAVLVYGTIQVLIMFQVTLNSWWTRIVIGFLLFLFCFLQRLFESGKSALVWKERPQDTRISSADV